MCLLVLLGAAVQMLDLVQFAHDLQLQKWNIKGFMGQLYCVTSRGSDRNFEGHAGSFLNQHLGAGGRLTQCAHGAMVAQLHAAGVLLCF
jgi:hypothetical protein